MGVPLYIKGVIMSVELGSFWLIKDSGCIAIVKSIIAKANGGLTVVYVIANSEGMSSYRMSCEYELFINIAEKLITKSELKDELNKEYVDGKTDGYNEGYQHGFTLAKEKITELDEEERRTIYYEGYDSGHNQWQDDCGFIIPDNTVKNLEATNYKKGLKDKASINEATRKHHYDVGYNDALAHMASEEAENRLEIKKQGFEDGYNTAIKEMKSDKLNSGVCGSNVPNKETQEAMQEVLDKDSNEFAGTWVAKDGSGKLKVLSVNEGTCDVELIEHVSNSYLCVGDTANISVDDLKEHWNKERAECDYITTEDVQIEKELKLVEKYPHYYKDIRHLNIIDIYRFFDLFEVTDPCIQHSMKKLAVGGKRGTKGYEKDIKEAMDTLKRWEYMQEENKRGLDD